MLSRLQATFSSQGKPTTEEEADKADRVQKLERSLQRILVHAIDKYRSHGFEGNIIVGGSIGPFSSSVEHEVQGEEEEAATDAELDDDPIVEGSGESLAEKEESKSRIQQLAISSIDRVIHNLIQRSRAWRKFQTKGKGNTMLTSGLSMSDPFFGSISFSLELSVTLISLKAYSDTHATETAPPNATDGSPLGTTTVVTPSANSNIVQGRVL